MSQANVRNNGKLNFYEAIANNAGVEVKNVKSIFWWYDLLSFSLSFQLIFILTCSFGIDFIATMFSVLFIIITDTLVKITLTSDSKNYAKLHSEMALVKLWTIPLMIMAISTLVTIVAASLGLV